MAGSSDERWGCGIRRDFLEDDERECFGSTFAPGCEARTRGGKVGLAVWDLIVGEEAQDHIWDRHKIDASRLFEMLENRSILIPNRSSRRASHLLIGTDFSGQCYVVPILPTDTPGTWEVITAWPCRKVDLDRLRRS